jgi:A/G-specific adenine glycosylase
MRHRRTRRDRLALGRKDVTDLADPASIRAAKRVGEDQQVALAREVAARLRSWFNEHGRSFPWRDGHLADWQLLLTEVLLQQTPAARVAALIGELFERYATLESIAAEDEEKLATAISPLGLQHRRARRLRQLASALLENGGEVPRTRRALLELPGVGPYVANAFLSVAHGESLASLDVNMARVLERLFGPRQLVDIRYDPHLQATSQLIVELADDPRRLNWAILDLGARYCTSRNPQCAHCPLSSCCRSRS